MNKQMHVTGTVMENPVAAAVPKLPNGKNDGKGQERYLSTNYH